MKVKRGKVKIGIVGCGAIGSRIATSIHRDLKRHSMVTALYDIDVDKADKLSKKLFKRNLAKDSLKNLLKSSDFIIEAVNSKDTKSIVQQSLTAKKDVLVMSVGKVFNSPALFNLAQKNKCLLLLPSGAIAGIDAIKAAAQIGIKSVTLRTLKPIKGFKNNSYVLKKKINLDKIRTEKVIFQGSVTDAVKHFPQNINVAATLALAAKAKRKLKIQIIASRLVKRNTHEIELKGDFGRIWTKTENVICPDNPKTSYMAVLSAIQTVKDYFNVIKLGT